MPAGGARPGAGRPAKAEKFAGQIARAEKQIADHLPEVLESMLTLARGVTVQTTDEEGGVDIFTKPPDFKACAYLIDRILGKAVPKTPDAPEADRGIVKVVVEYTDPTPIEAE